MAHKKKRSLKGRIQDRLMAMYAREDPDLEITVYQRQPDTFALVTLKPGGQETFAIAKLSYKDKWDTKFGQDMAIRKAIAELAKELAKYVADHPDVVRLVGAKTGEIPEWASS